MNKANDFFEKLQNDPKAQELLAGLAAPDSLEETIKTYARIAGELGIDLTEAEISEEIAAREKAQAERTAQAAAGIKDLAPDELDAVAGGVVNPPNNCKETYKDKENCWWTDACDHVNNSYPYYKCKSSNNGACWFVP